MKRLFPFLAGCSFLAISSCALASEIISPGGALAECRRAILMAEVKEQSATEALAMCEQAVDKHHKDAWAYRYRSLAYSRAGQDDKSAADIQTALQLLAVPSRFPPSPATIGGFKVWAGLMYQYFAWNHADKGEWQPAVANWSQVIDVNPSNREAFLYRGVSRARLGNCAEAVADFDRFLSSRGTATEEESSTALYVLTRQGECYRKLGRAAEARAVAHRMIEIDPRLAAKFSGDAALQLFEPETRAKNMQDAATAARAAESGGNLLEAFAQWQAVRQWSEVLVVYPVFWRLYPQASLQLLRESLEALRRLYPKLPVKPALPEAARQFGVPAEREAGLAAPTAQSSEADKGRYLRAIDLYERALDIAPWWPNGYYNRAMLEERLDQYSTAAGDMEKYLALAADAPNARQAQDKVYEWKTRISGGSTFNPNVLVGAWSGPLFFYNYHARIAPDANGGMKLMVLDAQVRKHVQPVGDAYRLMFEGNKFKVIAYDDADTIVGGEVLESGNSLKLEFNHFACHGFIPAVCGNEARTTTWSREGFAGDGQVAPTSARLPKKAEKGGNY